MDVDVLKQGFEEFSCFLRSIIIQSSLVDFVCRRHNLSRLFERYGAYNNDAFQMLCKIFDEMT